MRSYLTRAFSMLFSAAFVCCTASATDAPITAPASAPATAPTTQPDDTADPILLTIHPAAVHRPALKYRLLPDVTEQVPGNAAPLYLYTIEMSTHSTLPDADQKAEEELDIPLHELRTRDMVGFGTTAAQQLKVAARRTYCHWETSFRDVGVETLLPQLGGIHKVEILTALNARYQIAQGDFVEASRVLAAGTALARSLNNEPCLVELGVSAAVEERMLKVVEEWIGEPGSPNLYWALSELPHPFGDVHLAYEMQRVMVRATLLHFDDAMAGQISAAHWDEFTNRIILLYGVMSMPRDYSYAGSREKMLAMGTTRLAAARQFLLNDGFTPAAVEGMQPYQILAAYWTRDFEHQSQELGKWANQPYPIARTKLSEIATASRLEPGTMPLRGCLPLYGLQCLREITKTDRKIAALRVIEAVRAYAADHDGRLPATLDAVTDLPIPGDPLTGKPFKYEVTGGGFTLLSSGEGVAPRDELRYEIKIAK